MKTNLFIPQWYDPVCSIIHGFEMGLSCRFGIASMRGTMERVRDELHNLVSGFEFDGMIEDDTDLFLDLFDALSFASDGLAKYPLIRGSIEQAVQILRKLRDAHNA